MHVSVLLSLLSFCLLAHNAWSAAIQPLGTSTWRVNDQNVVVGPSVNARVGTANEDGLGFTHNAHRADVALGSPNDLIREGLNLLVRNTGTGANVDSVQKMVAGDAGKNTFDENDDLFDPLDRQTPEATDGAPDGLADGGGGDPDDGADPTEPEPPAPDSPTPPPNPSPTDPAPGPADPPTDIANPPPLPPTPEDTDSPQVSPPPTPDDPSTETPTPPDSGETPDTGTDSPAPVPDPPGPETLDGPGAPDPPGGDGDGTDADDTPSPSTPPQLAAFGDACSATPDCAGELECISFVCDVAGQLEEVCSTEADCLDPFVCADGECALGIGTRAEGDACTAEQDCSSPLTCRDDVCTSIEEAQEGAGNDGTGCIADADCEIDLVCLMDECTERSSIGGFCLTTADCALGVCTEGNACTDPVAQVIGDAEMEAAGESSSQSSSGSAPNTGAIAGGVVAGVAAVAVLVGLLVFRAKRKGKTEEAATTDGRGSDGRRRSGVTTLYSSGEPLTSTAQSGRSELPWSSNVTPPLEASAGGVTITSVDSRGTGDTHDEVTGGHVDQGLYMSGLDMPVVSQGQASSLDAVQSYSAGSGGDAMSRDSHISPVLQSIQNRSLLETPDAGFGHGEQANRQW